MTTEPTTAVASLADVLRHIANEIDNFMPEPSHVTYYTYAHRTPIVGLTFNVEGAACVETWAAKYGTPRPTRQPRNESEWLTTDSFEFRGMTFQLAGHDPRESDPDPVATQPEPAEAAAVIVAETLDEPKLPRQYRDKDGDLWHEYPLGQVKCIEKDGGSTVCPERISIHLANREWGPLLEVTAQPTVHRYVSVSLSADGWVGKCSCGSVGIGHEWKEAAHESLMAHLGADHEAGA
jgi:hypothetical protein